MGSIQVQACAFCRDVWALTNMKIISCSRPIYVCPDCYDDFCHHYISRDVSKDGLNYTHSSHNEVEVEEDIPDISLEIKDYVSEIQYNIDKIIQVIEEAN